MTRRRRSDPHTFEQRLSEEKLRLESSLDGLPIGAPREAILIRIERLQAAAEMYDFLKLREVAAPAR